jgi:hypothetical protein
MLKHLSFSAEDAAEEAAYTAQEAGLLLGGRRLGWGIGWNGGGWSWFRGGRGRQGGGAGINQRFDGCRWLAG